MELPIDGVCELYVVRFTDLAYQFRLQLTDAGSGARRVMHAPIIFWYPKSLLSFQDVTWIDKELVDTEAGNDVECQQIEFADWWLNKQDWMSKVAVDLGFDLDE